MRVVRALVTFSALTLLGVFSLAQDREALQREEAESYYTKWLNEDVLYIISDEERAVFESLTTLEEKERFIEQFWFRRDPQPRTVENEFKAEHYRRIAYANERFSAGYSGWRTDRGRIYIIHGEPAEIESHASGGSHQRSMREGGGSTTTYPYEVWRYRHIEGVGEDILLEFVDPSLSGEYRLALNPEEKDALLYVPGGGATLAEELGLATKADRPYFSPGTRDNYPGMVTTARDNPFNRYETYSMVQAPSQIKYTDLKEMVEVNIEFTTLPIEVHEDYFRLNDRQMIVPVTVQLSNKDLTFQTEGDQQVAKVAVYGIVTSIGRRFISEFEDDLRMAFSSDGLEAGLSRKSVYQKLLFLDRKQRYKLDLVVKDLNTGQVGVLRKAIVPPTHKNEELEASSVIFAQSIRVLDTIPDQEEMFVIGDVKVTPNINRSLAPGQPLWLYYQVYNTSLDQSTMSPSLKVAYRLLKNGEVLREVADTGGESIQFFSGQRVVLVKELNVAGLPPGDYVIRIEVEDLLTGKHLELDEPFMVESVEG